MSEYFTGNQAVCVEFSKKKSNHQCAGGLDICIEAKERSRWLITADLALEQGKDVYALPGPVNSVLSQGCHRLIEQGAGILITQKN